MSEIPSRLSIDEIKEHRDLAGRLDIFVDGQLVHHVLSYDIERGEIIRVAADETGTPVLNSDGDGLQIEILRGKVAVQLRQSVSCPR